MSLTVRRDAALYILLIMLFPICHTIGTGFFQYYDEIIGVIAFIYMVYLFAQNRLDRIERSMVKILVVITIIGLVSNAVNMTVTNLFAISVDILWLFKTFSCYIMFYHVASIGDIKEGMLEVLSPISKLAILFVATLAILNIFADIGVCSTGMTVFGLRQFTFIWGNTIQTGWLLFSCLGLISVYEDHKVFRRYLYISCIPAILTFSSLVYCWFFIAVLMTIFFREGNTVKAWHIALIALGVVLLTFSDIQGYLLNESVRSTFWLAAIELANKYFPLGTGFASFGSDMAARYYSSVYVSLGWENTWALGRNGDYLNDNFFASILGQFGWIGFVLYLCLLGLLFYRANFYTDTKEIRTTSVASVLTIAAVMIGSASAKSLMGCCMFAVLGVVLGRPQEDGEVDYFESDALEK